MIKQFIGVMLLCGVAFNSFASWEEIESVEPQVKFSYDTISFRRLNDLRAITIKIEMSPTQGFVYDLMVNCTKIKYQILITKASVFNKKKNSYTEIELTDQPSHIWNDIEDDTNIAIVYNLTCTENKNDP